MTAKRITKPIDRKYIAALIEEIAKRVETKNYNFDIQVSISTVGEALLNLKRPEGIKLISRVARLLNTQNGKNASGRYGALIQKSLSETPPLDPVADAVALRALAADISRHDT